MVQIWLGGRGLPRAPRELARSRPHLRPRELVARLRPFALQNHSHSAWHPCGIWGAPLENSWRSRVASLYDASTIQLVGGLKRLLSRSSGMSDLSPKTIACTTAASRGLSP